jgi:hypothetical protein
MERERRGHVQSPQRELHEETLRTQRREKRTGLKTGRYKKPKN